MKVNTGKIYLTSSVNYAMENSIQFATNLQDAIERYLQGDWGVCCEEDKIMNDQAQQIGDRIVAKYETCFDPIFIITEWDQSATTVLFCKEY